MRRNAADSPRGATTTASTASTATSATSAAAANTTGTYTCIRWFIRIRCTNRNKKWIRTFKNRFYRNNRYWCRYRSSRSSRSRFTVSGHFISCPFLMNTSTCIFCSPRGNPRATSRGNPRGTPRSTPRSTPRAIPRTTRILGNCSLPRSIPFPTSTATATATALHRRRYLFHLRRHFT